MRPPQSVVQADRGIATGKLSGDAVKAIRALPQAGTLLNQPNQQQQQQQQAEAAAADETARAAILAEASRQLGGSSEEGHWTAEQVQTRFDSPCVSATAESVASCTRSVGQAPRVLNVPRHPKRDCPKEAP